MHGHKRENHHCEPVSLNGLNIEQNILPLKRHIHKQLHQTLDISYKDFGKHVRKMREMFNHKLIQSPDELERRADIQRSFFDNLEDLPTRLQHEHVKKMMEMYDYHNDQYSEITGYNFDKPKRYSNTIDQFNELHTMKTEIRKEIAQIFIDQIKNTLYHHRP